MKNYPTQIIDVNNPLHVPLLTFIEKVGSYSISPSDLRNYLRLFRQKPPIEIYKTLLTMTKYGKFPPFIEFDLTRR